MMDENENLQTLTLKKIKIIKQQLILKTTNN